MMQMAQPKLLLHNVSLIPYFVVPLNRYFRCLRPSRILPHDPLRGAGLLIRAEGCEADLSAPLLDPHVFPFQ
jgi:hypothetical protein